MLCLLLITICVLISNLVTDSIKGTTHELEDFTGKNDKELIETLANELLIDAKLHQRHVMVVREHHGIFLSYEVGFVVGQIREKYKRMMEVYHEAITKKNNRFNILPPYVADYKSLHFLVYMETIRSLEMEIDKLVHVLETIPAKMIGDRNAVPGMKQMMQAAMMLPPGSPAKESMMSLFPPGYEVLRAGPSAAESPADESSAAEPSATESSATESPAAEPETGKDPPNLTLSPEDEELKLVGPTTHPLTAEEVKQAYRDQYYSKRRDDNWTLDDYYGFPG